jgi:hypothetical protein
MQEKWLKMSLVVDVAVMFCVMCGCSVHRSALFCYVTPPGKQCDIHEYWLKYGSTSLLSTHLQ